MRGDTRLTGWIDNYAILSFENFRYLLLFFEILYSLNIYLTFFFIYLHFNIKN